MKAHKTKPESGQTDEITSRSRREYPHQQIQLHKLQRQNDIACKSKMNSIIPQRLHNRIQITTSLDFCYKKWNLVGCSFCILKLLCCCPVLADIQIMFTLIDIRYYSYSWYPLFYVEIVRQPYRKAWFHFSIKAHLHHNISVSWPLQLPSFLWNTG